MISLRTLMPAQKRGWLFHVMINRLGMRDALASRPNSEAVARRAQARCADCGRESACQTWLADNAAPSEAPSFCKNHDLFERLKHEIEAAPARQAA